MLRSLRTWRPALRIAARDARRHKGRSLLVAVMVGLPVLAGSAVDTLGRSAQLDGVDVAAVELGDRAQALVHPVTAGPLQQDVEGHQYRSDADRAPATNPTAAVRTAVAQLGGRVVEQQKWPNLVRAEVGDRALDPDLLSVDYTDPGLAGWIRQVDGRAPRGTGEAVADRAYLERSGARVGDTVTVRLLGGGHEGRDEVLRRQVKLVGTVTGAVLLRGEHLVVAPGFLDAAPRRGDLRPVPSWFLVDGPPVRWDDVLAANALGVTVTSRAVLLDPPDPSRVRYQPDEGSRVVGDTTAGIVAVAAVLVLLQITLLAGPALSVGARRNQRALAVVASTGGEPKVLRRVVLASGLVVGLVSSTVCAGVGILVAAASRGWFEGHAQEPLPRVDVHLLDLGVIVAIGTGTALAAAILPAVQAGRQDVVAALAGRRGQAPPRRRVAVLGLVLLAVGTATALLASGRQAPFLVAVGLAVGEFGLVALSGTLVALASRVAPRLPLAGRLALRDAARQRGRTAPAVAAVLAAVAGCSAAAVYLGAQDAVNRETYQPLSAPGVVSVGFGGTDGARVGSALRQVLPDAAVHEVRVLDSGSVDVDSGPDGAGREPGVTYLESYVTGRPFVDDGTVLATVTGVSDGPTRAALRAGRAVVFHHEHLQRDGTVLVRIGDDEHPDAAPREVRLPGYLSRQSPALDTVVLPPAALTRLPVGTRTDGAVAVPASTPGPEVEQRLEAALPGTAVHVERGYQGDYGVFLLAISLAAVVVALGATLAAVGLAAVESRADVATLAAVGAGPHVRRRLAAGQAAVVVVLGTALGVLSGVISGWAMIRLHAPVPPGPSVGSGGPGQEGQDLVGWHLVLPWDRLAVLAVGLPLVAVLAAALGTRSRLPMVRRLGQ